MKKYLFCLKLLLLIFILQHNCFAQQKKPLPKGFPPPHNVPRKKKDTTKPNPYLVDTLLHSIPFNRLYIHDKIENELNKADLIDGKPDSFICLNRDSLISNKLSKAIFKNIFAYKVLIENFPIAGGRDSIMENQEKIRCLTTVWELLRKFNNDNKIDADYYIKRVENLQKLMIAANENKLMEFVKAHATIFTLDNGKLIFENQPDVRAYIYTYLGAENPTMMIRRLPEYANDTFAEKIISADARIEPEVIYNYATSSNILIKNAILRTNDSIVQSILKIDFQSVMPLKSLSFLSDVYKGYKSVNEIDSIIKIPVAYYQNLVRLRITGDSIAKYCYTRDLSYRSLQYVRKMNELHDKPDIERFNCIDSLKPFDLYYIIVYGQEEIYTSTYLGVFKRLLERMNFIKGNFILDSLNNDHFRTFVRMCAEYNTLSTFLQTMNDTAKTVLMNRFISGLETGNMNELEDAVDIADAFGSINDSALLVFLRNKVKENFDVCIKSKNTKGITIYKLLKNLFEDEITSNIDSISNIATKKLHIPPISSVQLKNLANDSSIIYEHAYFFGDEDGQKSYQSFLESYKDTGIWHIDSNNYWIQVSSVKGNKIVIFANKPLIAPDDEEAQNKLVKYLNDSGINPTIIIHRGHSYHLPFTISMLNKYAKIVILGSCGGYHNLATVLNKSPDSHIISSKQTGSMLINDPIINAINNRILSGNDINWVSIWHDLDTYFLTKPELKEKYLDYVPPHKNLGAIFIKAYQTEINKGL